ncbi:MAG: hypothetical protein OXC40_07310 [Proteobacteria bacterium]|nr:hypothetical protein [Pseudomonadota bacterium]
MASIMKNLISKSFYKATQDSPTVVLRCTYLMILGVLLLPYHLLISCKSSIKTNYDLSTDQGTYYEKLTDLPGYYAWMLTHLPKEDGSHGSTIKCSATHIGDNIFLTAAHCFMDPHSGTYNPPVSMELIVRIHDKKLKRKLGIVPSYGPSDMIQPIKTIDPNIKSEDLIINELVDVVIHPQYIKDEDDHKYEEYDIAIFKLRFHKNDIAQIYAKADLPVDKELHHSHLYGQKVWLAGKGKNRIVSRDKEERGFFGGYVRIEDADLTQRFSNKFGIKDQRSIFYINNTTELENGNGFLLGVLPNSLLPEEIKGVCQGDSGSGVIKKNSSKKIVVGVMAGNFVEYFNLEDLEDLETSCVSVGMVVDVHHHLSFINSSIRELNRREKQSPIRGSYDPTSTSPEYDTHSDDEVFATGEDDFF